MTRRLLLRLNATSETVSLSPSTGGKRWTMARAHLAALLGLSFALGAPTFAHASGAKGKSTTPASVSKSSAPATPTNSSDSKYRPGQGSGVAKFKPNCGNGGGQGGADGAGFGNGRGNTCARALSAAQALSPG